MKRNVSKITLMKQKGEGKNLKNFNNLKSKKIRKIVPAGKTPELLGDGPFKGNNQIEMDGDSD